MLNLMVNVIPETAHRSKGSWAPADQPARGGLVSLEAHLEVAIGSSLQKYRAAGRELAACDWRDVVGWDNELGSVGRGDWPRPAAVRMQARCSGPHLCDDH